jgi:hypothetical protein
MMDNWLNILPIGLILVACQVVFLSENWRQILISLAVLYLGSFILFLQVWPFSMAAAKLITGWMCIAILSFVTVYQTSKVESGITPKRVFKSMSLVMIWMAAYLLSSKISALFQVSLEIAFTSFAILGCGLLQLGMSSSTFKAIIGILTFFAGFEILYAGLESSILVNGMILAVDLLIAFVGSYLVVTSKSGVTE